MRADDRRLDMSFIFMVLDWPEPGRRSALAQSMREMRALRALPGRTDVLRCSAFSGEAICG